MGIIQYPQVLAGQVGVVGALKYMTTTDNLSTVTAAGYLNNPDAAVFPIIASDVIGCTYNFNQQTQQGNFGIFTVTISNGVITMVLWVSPGNVLLPVTNGDFAVFNGTTGQIKDNNYSPSNAAKTKVSMLNGAVTANHIAVYTDTAGTIGQDLSPAINSGNIQAGVSGTAGSFISFPSTASTGNLQFFANSNSGNFNVTVSNASMGQATALTIPDPSASLAKFLLDTGANTMASGASIIMDKGTATTTGMAATVNKQTGVLTTESLTIPYGTPYRFTLTNSEIKAASVILLSPMGGTNTVPYFSLSAIPSAGSAQITVTNIGGTGGDPLNGTVIMGFAVF